LSCSIILSARSSVGCGMLMPNSQARCICDGFQLILVRGMHRGPQHRHVGDFRQDFLKHFEPLGVELCLHGGESRDVAAGSGQTVHESARYGFGREHHHDRDRFRRVLCGERSYRPRSHDEVDLAVNELGRGVGISTFISADWYSIVMVFSSM
jgi:hypothetical protein